MDQLEKALNRAQNEVLRKEKEDSELKLAVLQSEAVRGEEERGEGVELVEARRGRKVAEETVEQLQVRERIGREERALAQTDTCKSVKEGK